MHFDRWRAEVDLVLNTMAMNASTNSSILQLCDKENISCFEDTPPYISQGLALFRKGISLPFSLYDIYTHGCRMHVDGVSLRVNKKLKCSLISKKKCINMCTTKVFHELLKVHSVRTNISISKYNLLEKKKF